MEYTFEQTINGPVVVGDGDILFFNQYQQLWEYAMGDELFFVKARDFLKKVLTEMHEIAIAVVEHGESYGEEVLGGIYHYIQASTYLRNFERDVTMHKEYEANRGFPGTDNPNIPQF